MLACVYQAELYKDFTEKVTLIFFSHHQIKKFQFKVLAYLIRVRYIRVHKIYKEQKAMLEEDNLKKL